jgi:MFS family permease
MDEDRLRYEGWRVAAASGLAVSLAMVAFYTFAVFLKPLSEEFSWSRQAVSTAYGIMAATAAVTAPLLGYLFDHLGVRRVIVPGLVVAGTALSSLALLTPRLGHLYAVFAVLGVTAAGTSVVAYARVVSGWFERRRGAALAVVLGVGALGGVVHPPLAEALIRLAGWRGAWMFFGALLLAVGLPVVLRFVRERVSALPGASDPASGWSVRDALRSRAFWILVVVTFGSTLAAHGALVHLSALLTDHGVPASQAALVVSALGAANLAGRLFTGWLLDRFHAARIAFLLLALAALGALVLSGARSFGRGLLGAVCIGFGIGGELDVTPYLLGRYFGLRSLSTLYGLTFSAVGVAGMMGPVLLARAFDATGSYETTLVRLAVGVLAVATLLLALPAYSPRGPGR